MEQKEHVNKIVSNQTSWLAWIELACVVLLNMSINLRWLTFSPVASISAEYLNVNISAITWLSNCATLIYIAICVSTGWVFEKYGMKTCVSMKCVFISWFYSPYYPRFSSYWLLLQTFWALGSDISVHLHPSTKDILSSCLDRYVEIRKYPTFSMVDQIIYWRFFFF